MNFKEFITEQKNTHMTHIEDKVIYGGVNGTREAILALRSLRDMLGGVHAGNVSVKWDGAPAIFCGTDPRDGKFFVAKKGIFNKSPKVYKTDADIDADTGGDLNVKLKQALQYLPDLGIKGVVQGDFLFDSSDIQTKKIKGKTYVTFHPNTIVYAVPVEAAQEIMRAKIGVVWHTYYSGSTFETMNASFGVSTAAFKNVRTVWQKSANLPDISGLATLTKKETDEITKHISNAGKLFQKIAATTLNDVASNKDINLFINTFRNTKVRAQEEVTDSKAYVEELIGWIENRYNTEKERLKSDAGKDRKEQAKLAALEFFSDENKSGLISMLDMQNELVSAKIKLLKHLDSMDSINTFIKTKDGFRVTGAEGYVAIDHLTNGAVKIVDRMEFSYNNFSKDIIKGWESESR